MNPKIKKIIVKSVVCVLATAIFLVGYYFVYLYCGYQRRPEYEYLEITEKSEEIIPVNEELTLLTFNIGFGAYSDDYSFFMDGGEYGKALSLDAVEANLYGIINTIKNLINYLVDNVKE